MWETLTDDEQRRCHRDTWLPLEINRERQRTFMKAAQSKEALLAAECGRARALSFLLMQRLCLQGRDDRLDSWSEVRDIALQQSAAIIYYSCLESCLLAWVIGSSGDVVGVHEIQLPCNSCGMQEKSLKGQVVSFRVKLGVRCRDHLDDHAVEDSCADACERGIAEKLQSKLHARKCKKLEADLELEKMFDILIAPLANDIKGYPALIIIPDQELHTIPFAALRCREDKTYLVQRHSLRIAPSLQTLKLFTNRSLSTPDSNSALIVGASEFELGIKHTVTLSRFVKEHWGLHTRSTAKGLFVQDIDHKCMLAKHNKANPNKAIFVGDKLCKISHTTIPAEMLEALNMSFDLVIEVQRDLTPLRSVPQELRWVEEQCEHANCSETKMFNQVHTKEELRSAMESAGVLIHFATHGLLEHLSLVLYGSTSTNALLHAEEISRMRLQAKLVVLSACNTGRGEVGADGVAGLSRAFLAAGAQSVIATLWAVPYVSTAVFMREFYKEWLSNRLAIHEAVCCTMCRMIDDGSYLPHEWAAFAVIGAAGAVE